MELNDGKLIAALALTGVLALGATNLKKELARPTQAQDGNTDVVMRYKSSHSALKSTVVQWERNYQSQSAIQDMMSIWSLLDLQSYGLSAKLGDMSVVRAADLTFNGQPIGLTRVCLATNGQDFVVSAADFSSLLNGVAKISSGRKDIEVQSITISNEGDPHATLGGFCLLLRV